MLKGNKKIFLNSHLLYETLVLRRHGWSFTSLSIYTGADRTSIRDRARKYVVFPITEQIYSPEQIAVVILPKIYKPEKINSEKNYKDYLANNIPIEKRRIHSILGI